MTTLDYMNDTYCFESEATAIGIDSDEKGQFLLVDRTIFYPQGGGQETDMGIVEIAGKKIPITFVGFSDGKVLHYGNFSEISSDVDGEPVSLHVDGDRRVRNSSLHTAGHLVAGILDNKDSEYELRATKGYHFGNGAYVEFEGEKPEPVEECLSHLNALLKKAIEDDLSVIAETIDYDVLSARCRTVPAYLPKDKPLRIVTIGELEPLPCGGTHLTSTNEFSSVEATKMKAKKGKVRISYTCALN